MFQILWVLHRMNEIIMETKESSNELNIYVKTIE